MSWSPCTEQGWANLVIEKTAEGVRVYVTRTDQGGLLDRELCDSGTHETAIFNVMLPGFFGAWHVEYDIGSTLTGDLVVTTCTWSKLDSASN